jgi:hypothetical protein
MKRNGRRIVIFLLVTLVIAGGAFYGGMVYGKGQAQPTFAGAGIPGGGPNALGPGGTPPAGSARPGSAQAGMVMGQITEVTATTLTITDSNGKTTQINVSDTTLIEKQASVTLADLAQGETVMVSGSQQSDGSITARSVQVAPAGRMVSQGADSSNTTR